VKVLIIGCGIVGTATGEGLIRAGHSVFFYDIDKARTAELKSQGYATVDAPIDCDLIMVCTPEGVVEDIVGEFPSIEGLLVIRSTVLPGTTSRLMAKYDAHICHNPEFLREATSLWDFLRPHKIVIGQCCQKHGDLLEELYKPFNAIVIRVDPTTSEMIKMVANACKASMVSFWNEICMVCEKIGVNSHLVGRACSLDPSISPYGAVMHGKAFGKQCLPKDLDHLIDFCEGIGHDPSLLKTVREVNEVVKKRGVSEFPTG